MIPISRTSSIVDLVMKEVVASSVPKPNDILKFLNSLGIPSAKHSGKSDGDRHFYTFMPGFKKGMFKSKDLEKKLQKKWPGIIWSLLPMGKLKIDISWWPKSEEKEIDLKKHLGSVKVSEEKETFGFTKDIRVESKGVLAKRQMDNLAEDISKKLGIQSRKVGKGYKIRSKDWSVYIDIFLFKDQLVLHLEVWFEKTDPKAKSKAEDILRKLKG